MKVVFTGGGSGGHFYPILAVAEELKVMLKQDNIENIEYFFVSDDPYDQSLLEAHNITFKKNTTGKLRMYFSVQNIFDSFRTSAAVVRAFFMLYKIYPDVVFSKGAYPSFPVTIAARLLRIPVIVHESDTVPGRANRYAGSFARRIAVSYPEAADFFPPDRVARTGNPIRKEMFEPITEGSWEHFGFDSNVPVLFILGGSQGAQIINDVLLKAGPELIKTFQVIHQIGPKNISTFKATMDLVLEGNPNQHRYVMMPYLNLEEMRRAAGIADMVISRGGSTIFEIAAWGKPSIIIPITHSNGNHQMKNAYAYARVGACEVIEEENLTERLFIQEIQRILGDTALVQSMKESAVSFATEDAAKKIAREIMNVLKSHQ
jgi:UDP-N-acetylglucosamine--N-acetylmuramyl-(pentapeptide) pyrophosphoryl-undecaprenol N-acetylglucosamine transferase